MQYNYSTIKEMREAIFSGMNFDEYFTLMKSRSACAPKKDKAMMSWKRAHASIDNNEVWRQFMMVKIKNYFDQVANMIDDYYNEGFGYNDLSEALGISKEAVAEIVQKIEMG